MLVSRGDLNGAIAEYYRATELLPRYPVFHFNLGFALDLAGEFAAAIRSYEKALELDPTYVKALNNLAFVYLETGELDKAQRLLQQGLSIEPDAAYLHKNLGRVYLAKGRTAGAIDELSQAIQLSNVPYAEAFFYLAHAYHRADQSQAACDAMAQYAPLMLADAQLDPDRAEQAEVLVSELQCP